MKGHDEVGFQFYDELNVYSGSLAHFPDFPLIDHAPHRRSAHILEIIVTDDTVRDAEHVHICKIGSRQRNNSFHRYIDHDAIVVSLRP